jgi:hypothetical protein
MAQITQNLYILIMKMQVVLHNYLHELCLLQNDFWIGEQVICVIVTILEQILFPFSFC